MAELEATLMKRNLAAYIAGAYDTTPFYAGTTFLDCAAKNMGDLIQSLTFQRLSADNIDLVPHLEQRSDEARAGEMGVLNLQHKMIHLVENMCNKLKVAASEYEQLMGMMIETKQPLLKLLNEELKDVACIIPRSGAIPSPYQHVKKTTATKTTSTKAKAKTTTTPKEATTKNSKKRAATAAGGTDAECVVAKPKRQRKKKVELPKFEFEDLFSDDGTTTAKIATDANLSQQELDNMMDMFSKEVEDSE
jgi:hypothetical protein